MAVKSKLTQVIKLLTPGSRFKPFRCKIVVS